MKKAGEFSKYVSSRRSSRCWLIFDCVASSLEATSPSFQREKMLLQSWLHDLPEWKALIWYVWFPSSLLRDLMICDRMAWRICLSSAWQFWLVTTLELITTHSMWFLVFSAYTMIFFWIDWLDPNIHPSILLRILYNYIYISHTTERGSALRFVIHLFGVFISSSKLSWHPLCLQNSRMDYFLGYVFIINMTVKNLRPSVTGFPFYLFFKAAQLLGEKTLV